MQVTDFNELSHTEAAEILGACLDIDSWVQRMLVARPYPDLDALLAEADKLSALIHWPEVAAALARHPRIGEKPTGESVDASWSAQEQAGVEMDQEAALAAGNAAYEARFGHIFLICAAGLSGAQMLANLRERMSNEADVEHDVVIEELRKIAYLRLERLF